MRLRAWDVSQQRVNDGVIDYRFRVRWNKWMEYQFRANNDVYTLQLRDEYTEKLIKIPLCKFVSMETGIEPNGDYYQEFHVWTFPIGIKKK
jgi:hypothetical protein